MKFYRGGSWRSDFLFQPLHRCLAIEEERGNEDTRIQVSQALAGKELTWEELIQLAKEKELRAIWLADNEDTAAEYGDEVKEYDLEPNEFTILAEDNDDGFLISFWPPQ